MYFCLARFVRSRINHNISPSGARVLEYGSHADAHAHAYLFKNISRPLTPFLVTWQSPTLPWLLLLLYTGHLVAVQGLLHGKYRGSASKLEWHSLWMLPNMAVVSGWRNKICVSMSVSVSLMWAWASCLKQFTLTLSLHTFLLPGKEPPWFKECNHLQAW